MTNTTGIVVGHKPARRRLSTKQKATSLFQLWHGIQDMKAEAEQLKDDELVLLFGMVELLVEERTAGLGRAHGAEISAAASAHPN